MNTELKVLDVDSTSIGSDFDSLPLNYKMFVQEYCVTMNATESYHKHIARPDTKRINSEKNVHSKFLSRSDIQLGIEDFNNYMWAKNRMSEEELIAISADLVRYAHQNKDLRNASPLINTYFKVAKLEENAVKETSSDSAMNEFINKFAEITGINKRPPETHEAEYTEITEDNKSDFNVTDESTGFYGGNDENDKKEGD